jgi:uncharacterized protein
VSTASPRSFERAAERIGAGKYVLLTTFRKNGRPVATPVGCVVEAGTLYMLTPPDTGKVKRIRNNSRVTLAPCTMSGTVLDGAPTTEGTARLLDEAEAARVQQMMMRRTFMYRLVRILDRVLRRRRPLAAIAVTA